MTDLFSNYSLTDIILIVLVSYIAIKELITEIDWSNSRLKKHFNKNFRETERKKDLERNIREIQEMFDASDESNKLAFDKINQTFDMMDKRIEMLIDSDREDIKSAIVDKHHFFVYDQQWIDDYSLQCLEKRFKIYQEEDGNSFVEGLMEELRDLPKLPPENDRNKYDTTETYMKKTN